MTPPPPDGSAAPSLSAEATAGVAAPAVLTVRGLQHAYGPTVALRGIDLDLAAGEVVAITGPSGCGKSTLLHVCAGLMPADCGEVTLLGERLDQTDPSARAALRRRRLGLVLQYGQLVPELTALDNVALPLLLDRRDPGGARAIAADWLRRCGADECRDLVASSLSGGQSQRVAVARALVTRPAIVLADEPTGSLDRVGGAQVLGLLLDQARESGAGVLLVTHDATVAARADREIRLLDGAVRSRATLS